MANEQQSNEGIVIPDNILRIICEHGGHHEAPRALKLWRRKIRDHEQDYMSAANEMLYQVAQNVRIHATPEPASLDYVLQHAIVKDGKILLEGDVLEIFNLEHLQSVKRFIGYNVVISTSPAYIQHKGKTITLEPDRPFYIYVEWFEPFIQVVNTDDIIVPMQKETMLQIERYGMSCFYYHLPIDISNLLNEYKARMEAELKVGGGYTVKDIS